MSKTTSRIKFVTLTIIENDQEKQKTITIKKAGLGKWKQLSETMDRLKNIIPEFLEQKGIEDPDQFIEDLEPMDLLEMVPELFRYAADELVKLLALGTDLEPDFIEEHVGIDEAWEILLAIGEVSGVQKMAKNLPILQLVGSQTQIWRNPEKKSSQKNRETKLSTVQSGK